ncbi:hypothetical protein DBV15_02919, partial [Temnothorax longispinosus]
IQSHSPDCIFPQTVTKRSIRGTYTPHLFITPDTWSLGRGSFTRKCVIDYGESSDCSFEAQTFVPAQYNCSYDKLQSPNGFKDEGNDKTTRLCARRDVAQQQRELTRQGDSTMRADTSPRDQS